MVIMSRARGWPQTQTQRNLDNYISLRKAITYRTLLAKYRRILVMHAWEEHLLNM